MSGPLSSKVVSILPEDVVTVIGPSMAPSGTTTKICVFDQASVQLASSAATGPATPVKRTLLVKLPKPLPDKVTHVPGAPSAGVTVLITGKDAQMPLSHMPLEHSSLTLQEDPLQAPQ